MINLITSLSFLLVGSLGYVIDLDNSDSLLITVDDSPVLVELYYESLCPGCRRFISTMLFPAFDKLRDTGIVEFGLYPYGNAQQAQNRDGSWNFTCQHGGEECLGNLLEVCLINHLNRDFNLYLPVISCMESADDPVQSAEGCISQLSTASYEAVKNCANGPEGNKLEHEVGTKTESLDPPHNYVPWIVVDGQHDNDIQTAAMDDLVGLVCKLYEGVKPAVCREPQYDTRTVGNKNYFRLSYLQNQ